MLVLVSDLHLTDRPDQSSFRPEVFVRTIASTIRDAKDVRLVLVGDILEMLKSKEWVDRRVRPWETITAAHQNATNAVFDAIVASNQSFFDAITALRTQYGVSVAYVPGNHDRPLNTSLGDGCRSKFRAMLGIEPRDDRLFREDWEEPDYGLLARHGHQWDGANRYRGRTVAIGDFVVIEILARLPHVLSAHLHMDAADEALRFARELDDVVPHSPASMGTWLSIGIKELAQRHAREALQNAVGELAEEFEQRMHGYRFETVAGKWWVKLLKGLAVSIAKRVDTVSLARRLFGKVGTKPPRYVERAKWNLDRVSDEFRCVVFGHTHVAESRTMQTPRGECRYLNCGTWRRFHRLADYSSGPSFAESYFGSMVVIRKTSEVTAAEPRYELRQSFYG